MLPANALSPIESVMPAIIIGGKAVTPGHGNLNKTAQHFRGTLLS